jgi:phosphoglycerate dehydrogenase-like enzyme
MMRRMSKDATPRRPRVFVYRGVDGAEGSYRELERAGCELALGSGRESRAEMLEQTRGSDVLLGATYRGGIIDRTLLEASAGLRLISKYTIGVDDVDIASAMASFVAIESRHATVLASLSGRGDDFDALFLNPAIASETDA